MDSSTLKYLKIILKRYNKKLIKLLKSSQKFCIEDEFLPIIILRLKFFRDVYTLTESTLNNREVLQRINSALYEYSEYQMWQNKITRFNQMVSNSTYEVKLDDINRLLNKYTYEKKIHLDNFWKAVSLSLRDLWEDQCI